MARSSKIIICSILILLVGYSIFATAFSAVNSPTRTKVSEKSIYSLEDTSDKELYVYHESSSTIIYIIVEATFFAICVCYLCFTHMAKKNLSDVFKENKGMIYAYLCSVLSLLFIIEYIILYLIQMIILKKFM